MKGGQKKYKEVGAQFKGEIGTNEQKGELEGKGWNKEIEGGAKLEQFPK